MWVNKRLAAKYIKNFTQNLKKKQPNRKIGKTHEPKRKINNPPTCGMLFHLISHQENTTETTWDFHPPARQHENLSTSPWWAEPDGLPPPCLWEWKQVQQVWKTMRASSFKDEHYPDLDSPGKTCPCSPGDIQYVQNSLGGQKSQARHQQWKRQDCGVFVSTATGLYTALTNTGDLRRNSSRKSKSQDVGKNVAWIESKTQGKQEANKHKVKCWFLRRGRPRGAVREGWCE